MTSLFFGAALWLFATDRPVGGVACLSLPVSLVIRTFISGRHTT